MKDLEGKVVFLNFWYYPCPPALQEMEVFSSLDTIYEDAEFLLLSIAHESPRTIDRFVINKDSLDYKVALHHPNRIEYEILAECESLDTTSELPTRTNCADFGDKMLVNYDPVNYIVDRNGIIRYAYDDAAFVKGLFSKEKQDSLNAIRLSRYQLVINELLKE